MKQAVSLHVREGIEFLRFIARRFQQDRCAQIAASLTFTTLLSLVPLLTIALTLFSAFPVFADLAAHIREFALANLLPETGGKVIARYMQQFAESAVRLRAAGIVMLALTAMLMMLTIDNAFNTIWRTTRQRRPLQRILVYWAVLTLAPLLVGGSLSLTSWLVGWSVGYAKQLPVLGMVTLKVVPGLLTWLAFGLLFRLVPNRPVPLRHAAIGGAVAAVVFESMNRLFAFYITQFPTYKLVYGTFSTVPIFLMWIYLSWFAVLLGALVTAALSHWRSSYVLHFTPVARLYYAVQILRQMHEGLRSGQPFILQQGARQLRLGYDEAEKILIALERRNMVRPLAGGDAWALLRDARYIRMGELAELFLWDGRQDAQRMPDAALRAWLEELERGAQAAKERTLQEVWA